MEVLSVIKADPALRHIPIAVLTMSKEEEDILRAYQLAANCYVTKPFDLGSFMRVMGMLETFIWLARGSLVPRVSRRPLARASQLS